MTDTLSLRNRGLVFCHHLLKILKRSGKMAFKEFKAHFAVLLK